MYVIWYVPPFFANYITHRLITHVSVCYTEQIIDCRFCSACEEISFEFLMWVIHSSVKSRDFVRNEAHPSLLDYCGDLIYRIISIVKTTRCTGVSNLFYFGMTLYMFRSVFPSIIRSSRLYIQQYLFDKYLLLCVQSWAPDDGRKDRPKHVDCHSKIKQIWHIGASSWFYCRNNITMQGPMKVKLIYKTWLHLYRARSKITQLLIPTHAHFHWLKFIKNI